MDKWKIRKNRIVRCFAMFGTCFLCCLLLNGCVGVRENPSEKNSPKISKVPVAEKTEQQEGQELTQEKRGYLFVYGNLEIAVDMPAAPVLAALGEEQSIFEAENCALGETIRTYSYGSFELDTYELNGEEYISCICFRDDTVETSEGIRLFMTQEQLISTYGTDYEEETEVIVYSKDKMKLKFIMKEKEIVSIQYNSLVTDIMQ